MKLYKNILLAFCCVLAGNLAGFAQKGNAKEIEKMIAQVRDKAFAANVKISAYDTVQKKVASAGFSGVAVSKEGHILTVAHAARTNVNYLVTFPNGGQFLAKGLGRIAIKKDSVHLDLAIVKIVEKGSWNFVEIADNETMNVNDFCLGISYPMSFTRKIPNVRLGRISDVVFKDGFFESTCKMEPGDSGGGLFNREGKVIGIHSYISMDEEQNFEIPVNYYKKYWTALNQAIDYKQLPVEDIVVSSKKASTLSFNIPPIQSLLQIAPAQALSVVNISSKINGVTNSILGTLVSLPGAKSKTYIVSKNSMVGDTIVVLLKGATYPAKVVARQKENDLVLLDVGNALKNEIVLGDRDSVHVSKSFPGSLLVSALGIKKQYVSVLSSELTQMSRGPGSFGANATFIKKKITITQITPNGAASKVLKLNDQINGINGVPISQPFQYGEQISKYFHGDSITVELVRDGKEMQVKLGLRRNENSHIAYEFAGGRSLRSDGFKSILIHDAAIKANDCGGPVFDVENRFYGINIARHSRTATIILPSTIIYDFIKNAIRLNNNHS